MHLISSESLKIKHRLRFVSPQAGSLTISDCSFKNNSASLLGGAIFVDRKSELQLRNTYMESAAEVRLASQQGNIVYSYGRVDIRGGHLVARSASDHVTLLQHRGDRWSIAVYNVSVICPIGHKVRLQPDINIRPCQTI